MWRTDSLEKTLRLGKIEDWRRRGRQRMRWLIISRSEMDHLEDWKQEKGMIEDEMRGWVRVTDSMDMSLSKLQELVTDREALRPTVHGVTKSQARLSDWTELSWTNGALCLLKNCQAWTGCFWHYCDSLYLFGRAYNSQAEALGLYWWILIEQREINVNQNGIPWRNQHSHRVVSHRIIYQYAQWLRRHLPGCHV